MLLPSTLVSTDPSPNQPEYQGEPWRGHDPNAAQPGQQPPQQPWIGGPWQWPESQPAVPPAAGGHDPHATQQVWPNTGDLAGPGVLADPGPAQQYQQPPAYQPGQPASAPPYPVQQQPYQAGQPASAPPYPVQQQPYQAGQPASAPPYPAQPQQQSWASQPPVSSPPISTPPTSGAPVSGPTPQPQLYQGQPQAMPVYRPQAAYPPAQTEYPPAQMEWPPGQPEAMPRPGWTVEQPPANGGGDWQASGDPSPGRGRLWIGLLVGLLVGAAIAAPAAYFLKPSSTAEPKTGTASPSAAPSQTLSSYEQTRLAINKPKFGGDLTKLAEPWLPYLGDCASNAEGGPAAGKGQTTRITCKYSGVVVAARATTTAPSTCRPTPISTVWPPAAALPAARTAA
jgi:hypothetical protein